MAVHPHTLHKTEVDDGGLPTRHSIDRYGIVYGEETWGTDATDPMTDGQILVGQTGGPPVPRTITGDVTINAAGEATLDPAAVVPADGSITTAKLADGAVTTAKLADGAVTQDKIDGSVILAPWSLETAPASAHAYDDELTSNSITGSSATTRVLNGKWDLPSGGTVVTSIDVNATPATNAYNIDITSRPGRIRVQCGPMLFAAVQTVTLPTNCVAYARLSATTRYSSYTDGNSRASLVLRNAADTRFVVLDLSVTISSLNNGLRFVTDTGTNVQFNYADRGISTPVQWAAIRKIGTTYEAWVAPSFGQWSYVGRVTGYSHTLDRVSLLAQNANTATPGAMVTDIGPFRFNDTGTLP